MSRRPRSELQFGSDSFLDVVANIVGILIILIVIAGLRVSQAPVRIASTATAESSAEPPAMLPPEAVDEEPGLEPLFAADAAEPNPAPLAPEPPRLLPAEPLPLEPPRGVPERVDAVTEEIERIERRYREVADQTAAAKKAETELNERLTKLRAQTASKERLAGSLSQEMESRHSSTEQLRATAALLLKQIEEEERRQPPIETMEHRVTPVSKMITGHEQHYRLIGNRVSEVPVTSLTIRLRDQIERRKDWLMKQRSHQGTVGPINGYTMHYTVARDNLGVLDEVRYGGGVVRISVEHWRIEPEPDLHTESAAEALQQGAHFFESLVAADEGTSLTFWVYPDSYGIYRKLQKFAHEHGFLVAGRPLPVGIPISGSPNGSKSAGQ